MDILLSMEQTTAAARLLMPSPMLNGPNYVSVFRIDGVPILPPLMTNEKRNQMKKLKEKAMELEKKLEAKRHQSAEKDLKRLEKEEEDETVPYSPPFSEKCPSARSAVSSVSKSSSQVDQLQPDSYLLLSNIMKSAAQEQRKFKDSSTCTLGADINADTNDCQQNIERARQRKARMQKLQKSETLIYDNCSNTIIMPIGTQQNAAGQKQQEHDYELKQVLENPNIGYRMLEQQIPVICVNPPTPLVAARTFCEKLNTSVDGLTGGDLFSPEPSDEPSTDESGHSNSSTRGLKSHKKVTNITAKIIQFETFCDGGSGVVERLEPPCMKPPLRSATSPSLKPPPLSPNSTKIVHHKNSALDSNTETSLVRSNSFTLDGPSKALLDHIRQQNIAAAEVTTHIQNTKRCYNYPSASATRDTVESKAKRVQKVELKQRPQAMRNAAKPTTLSPYTYNTSNSKKQRSPYDIKSGHKTKVLRTLKPATAISPSATGLIAPRQVKPKSSLATLTNRHQGSNQNKNNSASKILQPELLSEIEEEHRQKLVRLVAQQKEEKKRLQMTFEAQQKLLLDQISVDMDQVQSKRSAVPLISSSQEVSPVSGSELSDHAPHKLSSPLSLSSSTNSYSVVSSRICDLTASAEETASLESTTTATTTLTSNRHCTPRRRLFSREHSPTLSAANMSATTTATSAANKRLITNN